MFFYLNEGVKFSIGRAGRCIYVPMSMGKFNIGGAGLMALHSSALLMNKNLASFALDGICRENTLMGNLSIVQSK